MTRFLAMHLGGAPMLTFPRIPAAAAHKPGYYLYVYVNPLDGKIFEGGKGKGSGALAHVGAKEKPDEIESQPS